MRKKLPHGPKQGIENAVLFNVGTDGKEEKQFTKKLFNYQEDPREKLVYLLVVYI
jgi:hypothetical protein